MYHGNIPERLVNFITGLLKMQYSILEFKINGIILTKMTYTPYQAAAEVCRYVIEHTEIKIAVLQVNVKCEQDV